MSNWRFGLGLPVFAIWPPHEQTMKTKTLATITVFWDMTPYNLVDWLLLKKTFVRNKNEVTGEGGMKLHNEELHYLCYEIWGSYSGIAED